MDRVVDGVDAGGAVVKTVRHGAGVVPVVAVAHLHAEVFVGGVDELAPADDLAQKAFDAISPAYRAFAKASVSLTTCRGVSNPQLSMGVSTECHNQLSPFRIASS